jgi:hypothetical protein
MNTPQTTPQPSQFGGNIGHSDYDLLLDTRSIHPIPQSPSASESTMPDGAVDDPILQMDLRSDAGDHSDMDTAENPADDPKSDDGDNDTGEVTICNRITTPSLTPSAAKKRKRSGIEVATNKRVFTTPDPNHGGDSQPPLDMMMSGEANLRDGNMGTGNKGTLVIQHMRQ